MSEFIRGQTLSVQTKEEHPHLKKKHSNFLKEIVHPSNYNEVFNYGGTYFYDYGY